MSDKPILFSAPMVRALLAGTKTQTRRVVSPGTSHLGSSAWTYLDLADPRNFVDRGGEANPFCAAPQTQYLHVWSEDKGANETCHRVYPRVEAGTRLWVRETWRADGWDDGEFASPGAYLAYRADGATRHVEIGGDDPGSWIEAQERYAKRIGAHVVDEGLVLTDAGGGEIREWPWRPSIFMPRWASRITLEVTQVRVQRLHEIAEDDARAEGVVPLAYTMADGTIDDAMSLSARAQYAHLWDSINGKRAPWSSNCFVWAYAFKVLR